LHWHRYKVEITLSWEIIQEQWVSDEWMVIDFSDIKQIANDYIDTYRDHWYMYQIWDKIWELATNLWMKTIEVLFVPTAENIAEYLYNILNGKYIDKYWTNLQLDSIKLYETPTSFVIYNWKK